MVVMTPREKWTDERLDDLNKKVDDGFARVDTQFARVDARFDRLEERIDGLNKTLIAGLFVVVAAIIGSNAALAIALA